LGTKGTAEEHVLPRSGLDSLRKRRSRNDQTKTPHGRAAGRGYKQRKKYSHGKHNSWDGLKPKGRKSMAMDESKKKIIEELHEQKPKKETQAARGEWT